MRKIKVRIIGEREECEELLTLLRTTGRMKRVRRVHRNVGQRVYSRTFGSASTIYYLEMTKKNRCSEVSDHRRSFTYEKEDSS